VKRDPCQSIAFASLLDAEIPAEIGATARSSLIASQDPGFPFHADFIDLPARIRAISAEGARALGSRFARSGPLHQADEAIGGMFCDDLGAEWDLATGAVVAHPLAEASASLIGRHPRPRFPRRLQSSDADGALALLEPGLPGLMESCFLLRGGWSFLDLCAGGEREAQALLDWSAEALEQRYAFLLEGAPKPAVIAYHDSLGTDVSAFLGLREFETLYLPRFRDLLKAIRARADVPMMVMVAGASRPLLRYFSNEGVDIIGVDCNARGMTVPEIRAEIGSSVVLRGAADLGALGTAVDRRNLRGVAVLAAEFAQATPTIAAPSAPLEGPEDARRAAIGAAFLRQFDADQLRQLADIGPIRSLIEAAMRKVESFEFDEAALRPALSRSAGRRAAGVVSAPVRAVRQAAVGPLKSAAKRSLLSDTFRASQSRNLKVKKTR
jgi:hypothetical protein